MSWTDLIALNTIKWIRDTYGIRTFVETGTFKGINAKLQSRNFEQVITCEKNREYYKIAKEKLKDTENVLLINSESTKALANFRNAHERYGKDKKIFFYLDAHFYDPKLENKFVVLDELKALKGFKDAVIAIHDFDNGRFGHITYENQPLNLDLIHEDLLNVNPNFRLYTNTECDIIMSGKEIGMEDSDLEESLKYVWSSPDKTKRGILYALPSSKKIKNLSEI